MDTVVQLLRNALCTAKNFNLLGDTFLYDPRVTARYYSLPPPLDKTTPLEVLIAITQFYAFATITFAGWRMVSRSGVGKLRLIARLVDLRAAEATKAKEEKKKEEKKKKKDDDDDDSESSAIEEAAIRLTTQSLLDEGDAASRSTFVGANVLVLGLAFFWLVANSLHVTETDWIGGLWGLMHALEAAELALLVFLYYMLADAASAVRKSRRMGEFAARVRASGTPSDAVDAKNITAEQYGWLADGWSPFWAGGGSGDHYQTAEGRLLAKEEEAVASKLASLSKGMDVRDAADGIERRSRVALLEGYREYVYLVLNFLAFYGYMAAIITEYYEEEGAKPVYVRAMLMWMPNDYAGWLGNAAGDGAWTIEPLIIMGSPMAIEYMIPKREKKEKVA